MRIKPSQLANVLGITTDALRKQRIRGKSPYEFDVIEGRVFYDYATLPPSVRENIDKTTTKKTKQSHYDIKDPRYWNSIGKRNELKIRNMNKRIESEVQDRLAEERKKKTPSQEPRIKKQYAYWTNPNSMGNYWKSIEEYESKKKKKEKSINSYY